MSCLYHVYIQGYHNVFPWQYLGVSSVPIGLYRPIPAYTGLYRPIPAYTGLYRPIPAYTVLYRPIPSYIGLSSKCLKAPTKKFEGSLRPLQGSYKAPYTFKAPKNYQGPRDLIRSHTMI